MSLHHPYERLVRGALTAMSPRLEYPSVRAVLYCITAQSEGTEDEDNNNHAGCGAWAFELLVRRSRRPSRQKKPALSGSICESANIGWHAFARMQNDT
jgi:hypothetical protein